MTVSERVLSNMNLVYSIANKYRDYSVPFDDIVQSGMLGLVKAANTYDPTRRSTFGTYAAPCIKNEIRITLRKDHRHRSREVSINTVLWRNPDNKCGTDVTLGDILEDTSVDLDHDMLVKTAQEVADRLIGMLSARQRDVIKSMYGIGCPVKSQRNTALELGVSQPTVSRVHDLAISRMKNVVESEELW